MRILFDQGTPAPLREALTQHEVVTAYERGWSKLKNGELLDAAERDGFEVFVTTDSRLRYQQDLASRRIAIICLLSTSWPRIQRTVGTVVGAITPSRGERMPRRIVTKRCTSKVLPERERGGA